MADAINDQIDDLEAWERARRIESALRELVEAKEAHDDASMELLVGDPLDGASRLQEATKRLGRAWIKARKALGEGGGNDD